MSDLPSGTVTFLLTDVEGSTVLWEQAPEAMRAALARHDALFEGAVLAHGGVHVRPRGEGDSRFAVFASAPGAAAAALAIQQAFAAEAWPTPWPFRIRIGIHTGEAELRDGDYYGSTVNRCARLRNIGHGGQTLLSEATTALVRDSLPEGAALRDLGVHGLRYLQRPERVFQLTHAGLPDTFPPLASLAQRPHNLPAQLTPLIGREQEVQDVRSLLLRDDVRLVTLTGPGGTGKTRLALQVASDLVHDFPDGVWLVPLAPISDPELLISAVARALGLREAGGRSLWDTVASYLKEKRLLLILDNFEQILPAAPPVADLLAGCPNFTALVTSRAVLHLRGEHEYEVPPLALPKLARATSAEALGQYAAVALFIQRAVAVRSDFRLTGGNAPAVAEICRRVDGLPLAIELAAARVRLLAPQALLDRLERRLPLLTGGARDLPARQQTLRNAIAWSYDLLAPAEQALFRRLGVFVGGFTLEAAEAVCQVEARLDTLDSLGSLMEHSLLRSAEALDGEPRFGMLETIREYALEQLETSGEASEVRRRHAEFYLALAEHAEPRIRSGREQREWLARLEVEHDNLREALDRSLAAASGVETALRLAGTLRWFWWTRGHLTEGRNWLERALAAGSGASASLRANALHGSGGLAWSQGAFDRSETLLAESLALRRGLGDRAGIASSLAGLAHIARDRRDYDRAVVLFEECLALYRELGDRAGIADAVGDLGHIASLKGEYARAASLYAESLATFRELGDEAGIAWSLHNQGELACSQGAHERAIVLLRESLVLRGKLGDRAGVADSLERVAVVVARGQPLVAARLARE